MGNVGATELIVIALVALVLFGGRRIADVGKGLGQGIANFKQGLKEATDETPEKQLEKAAQATKAGNAKNDEASAKEA
ncbi:MAG: twin-arginine translocase TatA/TatE family subunit [Polyangiaceae bacterium]|nr:twin-arginine translocase TatA/TatE family subunit [Polyangiaceae bacterium]